MESEPGYRSVTLALLNKEKIHVGDVVELVMESTKARGTVVPRYQSSDDLHLVIKLRSGYNVGFNVRKIRNIVKVASGEKPAFTAAPPPKGRDELPLVSILGTGGTIASRVDYRTGAVHPAISSGELYSLIPELSEIARIEPEILLSLSSENLEPDHWSTIAEKVARVVKRGVRGVVITMGTDTMGYTAAALTFALEGIPLPVFIVASQRSSDRPSSDAYLNLIGAVSCAVSAEFSGVFVVMHNDTSDDKLAIHTGTRVRKNHTSARDAFESIGLEPVALWSRSGLQVTSTNLKKRATSSSFRPRTKFDKNAALVKFYPSMPPTIIRSLTDSGVKGIVLEGTGLGHVNRSNMEVITEAVKKKVIVCMTSQCIWGRVDMNVYDNGRDLLKAGVIPLDDSLGESSLVKLMWALANSGSIEEAKRMMRSNIAGEITDRSLPEA